MSGHCTKRLRQEHERRIRDECANSSAAARLINQLDAPAPSLADPHWENTARELFSLQPPPPIEQGSEATFWSAAA
jgi:hypothetical protein